MKETNTPTCFSLTPEPENMMNTNEMFQKGGVFVPASMSSSFLEFLNSI
jgi:hypothetical protein